MNNNFKFFILGFIFTFSLVMPSEVFSQLLFGLDGGLTYNGLTGDAPKDAGYKRKIDFTAGVHFEYKMTKDIIIGLGSRYYGTGAIVTYDVGEKETKDSFDISMSYISFPVSFKILTGGKSTYFISGLDYKQLLNADLEHIEKQLPDEDLKDRLQNYELSIYAGFGGIISFGRPSIGLELRYSHSLNNISKDFTGFSSGLPARFRFTGFQLLVFLNYSTW